MRFGATAILAMLAVSACEVEPGTETPGDPSRDCGDGPLDELTASLSRTTTEGGYEVVIVSATPAPPDVGFNDWVVEVDGADDVGVRPWMPLHGHGSPQAVYPGVLDDGQWRVTGMELTMAGLWELTVQVDGDAGPDEALFRFCLEG